MNKKDLRASIKKRLTSLSELERESLSDEIGKNLTSYLPRIISKINTQSVHVLGGFSPIQKEVLWFKSLFTKSQKIAVPHILDETRMTFFEIGINEIIKGKVGLELTSLQLGEEVTPDLLLIPGLAFDKSLNRLGRGAGYYDRYLEGFKGLKVGLCYDCQLIENIPIDEHDVKVDYLITEKNIYSNK